MMKDPALLVRWKNRGVGREALVPAEEEPMACRLYRIESIDRPNHSIRDRVRCTLTRLEDGRTIEVSMPCIRDTGQVIALEDSQVYFALWQP
jgi:hypothetical protein